MTRVREKDVLIDVFCRPRYSMAYDGGDRAFYTSVHHLRTEIHHELIHN